LPGTLHPAAEGVQKEWTIKRERKSPGYKTRWDQLSVVRCDVRLLRAQSAIV